MPFTPSHAVVALPFLRTPLLPAAVAVGAMTPDLPLFVRGTVLTYGVTHSPAWLPVTTVVALVLLVVWRALLRPAARELSPGWLARRLPAGWDEPAQAAVAGLLAGPGRTRPGWGGAALLIVALALGAASHIVWDLFTHVGRAGVVAVPALGAQWGPLPGYTWLQHGSSVLGLALIAVWALLWLRRADAAAACSRVMPTWVRWTWWSSLPVILAAAAAVGLAVSGPLTEEFTVAHLAYRMLPPACGLWGALTLALCVVVQVLRRASDRPAPNAVSVIHVGDGRSSQTGSSHPHRRGAGNPMGPPS